MCNDIELSIYKDDIGKDGFGYYDFDSSNKLRIDNNIVPLPSLVPIDQETTLSDFIRYKNIWGGIKDTAVFNKKMQYVPYLGIQIYHLNKIVSHLCPIV